MTTPVPSVAFGEAWEYWTDRWQRSILFWDVMWNCGNQSIEHWQVGKPPVLVFDYETVIDGRTLDRPATTPCCESCRGRMRRSTRRSGRS